LGENKGKPSNTADALWNDRYSVAVALVKGKVFVDDFSKEAIRDPRILELLERVEVQHDKSLAREVEVEIKTKDGRSFQRKVSSVPPMSRDEILEKFRNSNHFSAKPLPERRVESFIRMVNELEELDNVTKMINMLSGVHL
jgi:2-methylcitrate dehydratase PrpD